jgi:hypothetical protein
VYHGAGRSEHDGVQVALDPVALSELQHEATVEAAPGGEVDVLDGGGLSQVGILQAPLQTVVLAGSTAS